MLYLVIFGLLLLGAAACYWSKDRGGRVAVAAISTVFVALPCMGYTIPSLTVAGLLIFVASLAGACSNLSQRAYRRVCLGCVALMFAWTMFDGLRDVVRMRRMQREFPFESLADRLDYERAPNRSRTTAGESVAAAEVRGAAAESPDSTPEAPPRDAARWKEVEKKIDHWGSDDWTRRRALEIVHGSTVEAFVESPGFGVIRTLFLPTVDNAVKRLERPLPEPLPLDEMPPDVVASGTSEEDVRNRLVLGVAPDRIDAGRNVPEFEPNRLWETHADGVEDFLKAGLFGLVRSRDEVAGFVPHRFTKTFPHVSSRSRIGEAGGSSFDWKLVRLELVSLLKHPEPRVYESKSLPRMDELRDAPTRPLTTFESRALTRLRHGEDLEFEAEPQRLQMVGSLRTLETCRQCHHTRVGELLGAFSYDWSFAFHAAALRESGETECRRDGAADPGRVWPCRESWSFRRWCSARSGSSATCSPPRRSGGTSPSTSRD